MEEPNNFYHEEFGRIRTIIHHNEHWFVASDIAKSLGYRMASDMTRNLDLDEMGTHGVSTPGGIQHMTVISESGLYSAILSSKLPNAKKFKKWVTSEVLPSIRKNGGYISGQESLSDEELLSRALLVAQNKIAEKDATIELQKKEIELAKPKTIFADAVATSHTSILIGDLAKLICQNGCEIGQKRLFAWLRENGYLMKHGSSYNMPQQRFLEQGLFEVKERAINNPDGSVKVTRTTVVTGKGQIYFINKFLKGESK